VIAVTARFDLTEDFTNSTYIGRAYKEHSIITEINI